MPIIGNKFAAAVLHHSLTCAHLYPHFIFLLMLFKHNRQSTYNQIKGDSLNVITFSVTLSTGVSDEPHFTEFSRLNEAYHQEGDADKSKG